MGHASSQMPWLLSIVSVPGHEVVPGGFTVCHHICEVFDDETVEGTGALSPAALRAVEAGIRAALDLT